MNSLFSLSLSLSLCVSHAHMYMTYIYQEEFSVTYASLAASRPDENCVIAAFPDSPILRQAQPIEKMIKKSRKKVTTESFVNNSHQQNFCTEKELDCTENDISGSSRSSLFISLYY